MSQRFSVLREMNYKYFKLCCWKCFLLQISSWEGRGRETRAGKHGAPAPGSAPLSADVQRVLMLKFLVLHSAIYPTSKDNLSTNYQPLGQLPMAKAGEALGHVPAT
jgi:hypothetical protein